MSIQKAAYAFCITGDPVSCISFGHGHINHTYLVTTDTDNSYILQKINKYVFKDPVKVMANASAVTNYIRQRASDPRQALHFILSRDGEYYHVDEDGEYWRMYDYAEGFCLDTPESPEDFYQSALAFGNFQHMLSDFPADTLYETIPEFHNTVDRFRLLREAIRADATGRVASAQPEIACAFSVEERCCTLQHMKEAGQLPLRVTHNDTKLNNVLLDKYTRKSLCVLDLDTVMPGLSVHDFGDAIRFGAATAAEDEKDVSRMKLDLTMFEVFTKGFLETAPELTALEVKMLPLGALTMTLEVGIRFLTDYLSGDIYFRTAYSDHNLIRCRTQLALVADMLAKWDEMNAIVEKTAAAIQKN